MKNEIQIKGAREHNLKNVDVSIQKNKMTVITGLSGSGKSSLAFDTIHAEGQRRFIDSLSTYARNFMIKLNKPDVDSIQGLCPCVAIDQKTMGHSPRSTVGTVTEIYDYLRLLYSKVGKAHCPKHKIPVEGQFPDQIQSDILSKWKSENFMVLAPMARSKKGEFKKEVEAWMSAGYVSAKIDDQWVYLDHVQGLKKTHRHDIDLVIDKLNPTNTQDMERRLSQALCSAIRLSGGTVIIETKGGKRQTHSTLFACPKCDFSFGAIDPLLFSFNNPKGACRVCHGLGTRDVQEYEIVEHGPKNKVRTDWKINNDNPDFEWKDIRYCKSCHGSGLKPEALHVFYRNKNIFELCQMSIKNLFSFLKTKDNNQNRPEITAPILSEILSRLEYLKKVGTDYLCLSRRSKTLSGGELQRIRLASQVGIPLVGVLYVLDEPSIGLHPRDHNNVLQVLDEIKKRGNTIIVVEHDKDTIQAADNIIDIGPMAGQNGGHILFQGPFSRLKKSKGLTSDYLSGRKKNRNSKKTTIRKRTHSFHRKSLRQQFEKHHCGFSPSKTHWCNRSFRKW